MVTRGRTGGTGAPKSTGGASTPIGYTGSTNRGVVGGYGAPGRGRLGHTGDKNSLGGGQQMGQSGSQSSATVPHGSYGSGRDRTGHTGDQNSLGSGRGLGSHGSQQASTVSHSWGPPGRGRQGHTGDASSLGSGRQMGDSGYGSSPDTSSTQMHGGAGMGIADTPFNPIRFASTTNNTRRGIPSAQRGAAGGASMHGLKAAAKKLAGHGNSWKVKKGTNIGTGTMTTGPMADSPPHYNLGKG